MSLIQTPENPPTNSPIARRVTAFRVVHFDPGSVIAIDGHTNKFTLYSNQTFHAEDVGQEYFEDVWLVSGNVVIQYTHAKHGRMQPAPEHPGNSSTFEFAGDVLIPSNPAPGAVTKVLSANATRSTLGVQNNSTCVIVLSTDVAQTQILARLAAAGVNGDGSGGEFSLDGYTGALYAQAVSGPALPSSTITVVAM